MQRSLGQRGLSPPADALDALRRPWGDEIALTVRGPGGDCDLAAMGDDGGRARGVASLGHNAAGGSVLARS
jgi:hypothetical protein